MARCTCALSVVGSDEAPVAVELARPGGWLGIRRHGSGWLRPVTAPGGWEPIGWDGFREAVSLCSAWNDNPFVAGPREASPAFALGTYAMDVPPAGPADLARRAGAAAAAAALAGTLCIVDGIVHRACPEPSLHQVERDGRETLAWVLDPGHRTGMLSMLSPLGVFPRREPYPCAWDVDRAPRPDPAMGFGLADAPSALAAMAGLLESNGSWMQAPGLDTADIVRVARPDLVDAEPGSLARAAALMSRRLSGWLVDGDPPDWVHGGDRGAMIAKARLAVDVASGAIPAGPPRAAPRRVGVADFLLAVAEAAVSPPPRGDEDMAAFSP